MTPEERLELRWRASMRRSQRRRAGDVGREAAPLRRATRGRRARRPTARLRWVALLVSIAALALGARAVLEEERAAAPAAAHAGTLEPREPPNRLVRNAVAVARSHPGLVSVAVVDAGGLRGHEAHRRFPSASAVKALLLAAELRRLHRERLNLDSLTADVLELMITISDNGAADEIYSRVGDRGLRDIARRAGMRRFRVSGHWTNAEITAADMARFFFRLGRNLVGPHRRFARNLLATVAEPQRWGMPAALAPGWRIWFKGGWRATGSGELVHQAALLEHDTRGRIGLAVLTDAQPSQGTAIEAIEKVTRRLLARR